VASLTDAQKQPHQPSAAHTGHQAALPSDAQNLKQAANTAAAKLNGTEEVVRKSSGAVAAPAAAFQPQQAADTAAAISDATEQAQQPTTAVTAPPAVALQQAANTAAATLDGSEQVQKPASTAPAAAALDPLQAANKAAASSSSQKKAAKPTGRTAAPAAMSTLKRAGDTAANKLNSAGQQTLQSTLPTAAQLPSLVPSRSVFHYDRMFPAQTSGTYSGSRNALPRQAEAKASR